VKSAHFSVATLEIELPPLMMPPLRNFMAAEKSANSNSNSNPMTMTSGKICS